MSYITVNGERGKEGRSSILSGHDVPKVLGTSSFESFDCILGSPHGKTFLRKESTTTVIISVKGKSRE